MVVSGDAGRAIARLYGVGTQVENLRAYDSYEELLF